MPTRRISARAVWLSPGSSEVANPYAPPTDISASSGELLAALEGHTGPVMAVALSSDGRLLASGSFDGSLRLWIPAAVIAYAVYEQTAATSAWISPA